MATLKFSKPQSYKKFILGTDAASAGIYIWGFKINGRFIPHYVGKHETSVKSRVISHFKGILNSSNYTVFTLAFYENLHKRHKQIRRMPQPYKDYGSKKNILLRFRHEPARNFKNQWELIKQNIFNEDDFYISYATGIPANTKLSSCETAIKFSLRYNTIGRSQSLQSLNDENFDIKIMSIDDCLKKHFYHFVHSNNIIHLKSARYFGYKTK